MCVRHHAALFELSQVVLADIPLQDLLDQVVIVVAHAFTVPYSAIWQPASDETTLVLHAGAGWPANVVGHATVAGDMTSYIGYTLLGDAPLLIADWSIETRFSQPAVLRDHDVVCSLTALIQVGGSPFGVLSADSVVRRVFMHQERYMLQAIANLLALAIERKHINQTLQQRVEAAVEHARLAVIAKEKAVQEERQRLARDLHDSVTQSLYGIMLQAEAATRLLAAGDVTTTAHYLRDLHNTAQEALEEMRLLIFDLRSPVLEQEGLMAALQARLETIEGRANLKTHFIATGIDRLPSIVEQALYRIAQEGLNNALKHARAQHITVQLHQTQSCVMLEISDDGIGFAPTVSRERGGFGLRGIEERIAQLKGTFTLQSEPGAGTRLLIEVAL